MATTALFVEILVVGLETAAWLLVLVLAVSGISGEQLAQHAQKWQAFATLLTTGTLAIAYVLGVIVDRVSDSLFIWSREDKDVAEKRLTVMYRSNEIAKFLEYQRSRLRIARGTVVNVLLAVPVTALYLWKTEHGCAVIAGLVFAGAVAWFAAERIHGAYMKRLDGAHALVTRSGPSVNG